MKPLTTEQAGACEAATTPPSRCVCRCGGRLHGAKRVEDVAAELPETDPHFPAPRQQAMRWGRYEVVPRTCAHCGGAFQGDWRATYCGPRCRTAASRARRRASAA